MSRLLVIGAGGHGKVVADAALSVGHWDSIAFVDDREDLKEVLGFPVIGKIADLEGLSGTYGSAAIAIGNPRVRLRLLEKCRTLGFGLRPIIHRSAAVSGFIDLGLGCVVLAATAINPGARIGQGCIVNTGATVDHDCELAEGVHVCPGAHLAGNVRVGARSWIGIGASIKHGITLGADVTVGAGAAVVSNIESGMTVLGVPARQQGSKR